VREDGFSRSKPYDSVVWEDVFQLHARALHPLARQLRLRAR
jgi:hypothetical protein